jgi:hypothetical protein
MRDVEVYSNTRVHLKGTSLTRLKGGIAEERPIVEEIANFLAIYHMIVKSQIRTFLLT